MKSQLNSSLHFAKWSSQEKYLCLQLSLTLLLWNDAPCFLNLNLSDQLEYQKNAHAQRFSYHFGNCAILVSHYWNRSITQIHLVRSNVRESPKVLQNKDITCLCYHWFLFTIFCLLPKSVGTKLCKVGNFTLNLNSLNCDKIWVIYTSCIHVIWLTLCDCYSLKEINASIL